MPLLRQTGSVDPADAVAERRGAGLVVEVVADEGRDLRVVGGVRDVGGGGRVLVADAGRRLAEVVADVGAEQVVRLVLLDVVGAQRDVRRRGGDVVTGELAGAVGAEDLGHALEAEARADVDLTRLAQVFSNLLNNAAKYTERGGDIRLSVEQQDGEVVVSVQDNGIGIPPEMLPYVFDMFTAVNRNLQRSQGGLGIGLSIVKKLVEMHGGLVEATSDGDGMGSQFIVRLPVVLSVAQPQAVAIGANDSRSCAFNDGTGVG